MGNEQNTATYKDDKINIKENIDLIIQNLKFSYNLSQLDITHESQMFRSVFYFKCSNEKPINMIIFSNGTLLLQGSQKIKKEDFQKEANQIIKMYKEICK